MEIHLAIQVTPVEMEDCSRVVVKAYPYAPTLLGEGYTMLNRVVWRGDPVEFHHAQSYVLSLLAKISHEIANDIEEAGFTTIADLMLKLSEHQ